MARQNQTMAETKKTRKRIYCCCLLQHGQATLLLPHVSSSECCRSTNLTKMAQFKSVSREEGTDYI